MGVAETGPARSAARERARALELVETSARTHRGASRVWARFLQRRRRAARSRRRARADARRARGERRPACSACRSRTRTSSSPPTCRPPPARGCSPAIASPFDATVVARLRRRRHRHAGQAELRRVRDGLGQRELGLRRRCATPGTRRACPAARRAARPPRWRRAWCRRPPAPTPAARSASRPASPASPASSRPTACARATAWSRSRPASTRPARWRASAEDCALLLSAMSGFDPRDSTSAERPPQDFHAQMLAPRDGATRRGRCRACASACRASSSRPALARRRRAAPCAPRWPSSRSSARRWSTSACRAPSCRSRSTTSSRRPRRVEPVALRRRALRPSRRAATTTCSTCTRRRRAEGFGAEVKRRIMIGTYVLSPRLLRRLLPAGAEAAPHDRRRLPAPASAQCDLIAGPVAPSVAWKLGAQGDDPVADLPGRHLHAAGQPGRPARHERARPASARAACRWACS